VQPSCDHRLQDGSGPAGGGGADGVPAAGGGVVEPVEQLADVSPGKLCHSLRHNFGPGGSERPHVLEVAATQPASAWEGGAKVGGESVDHAGAPALVGLPVEHQAADAPVHPDQFVVDRARCPQPSAGDFRLDRLQQRLVADGLHVVGHQRWHSKA